jgi:hypothetical protein
MTGAFARFTSSGCGSARAERHKARQWARKAEDKVAYNFFQTFDVKQLNQAYLVKHLFSMASPDHPKTSLRGPLFSMIFRDHPAFFIQLFLFCS